MNLRSILHLVSYILMFIGLAQLCSFFVGWIMGDSGRALAGLAGSTALSAMTAGVLWFATRGATELRRRDGYGVVTFGWMAACLLGIWPYYLTGAIPGFVDALFESCSGLTTTGASVMSNLEAHPRGVMFWRSISQWLGGMGVIVLLVALMPFTGVGALSLFQFEMPGPKADPLAPKIANTSKILWGIYLGLTALCAVCLIIFGMPVFDAVCNAFSTLSTGGFSPNSGSIGGYNSVSIEIIIILFMILGGTNFALHFKALRGDPNVYRIDREFRFFLIILGLFILIATLSLWREVPGIDSFWRALRIATFEITSMLTNTGFGGHGTETFMSWSAVVVTLIVIASFIGGCAGSTSGAVKIIRLMVAGQVALRELKQTLLPKAVVSIRIGKQSIKDDVVIRTLAFLLAFVLLGLVGTILVAPFTPDPTTAGASVYACLTNIGPGVGEHIGPDKNFAIIEDPGKIILCFYMILGRLELFTVLAIFSPYFWRR